MVENKSECFDILRLEAQKIRFQRVAIHRLVSINSMRAVLYQWKNATIVLPVLKRAFARRVMQIRRALSIWRWKPRPSRLIPLKQVLKTTAKCQYQVLLIYFSKWSSPIMARNSQQTPNIAEKSIHDFIDEIIDVQSSHQKSFELYNHYKNLVDYHRKQRNDSDSLSLRNLNVTLN